MIEQAKNRFDGLNADFEGRWHEQGDYTNALNVHVANLDDGNYGAVSTIRGNTLADNPALPEGENRVVGALSDRGDQAVYYFVWNSEDQHGIYRYNVDDTIDPIIIDPILAFDKSYLVHSSAKLGDTLVWTDRLNPIRQIDVRKALRGEYDGYTDEALDLIAHPPKFSPRVQYGSDLNRASNYLHSKNFQFRYRYIFWDGTKSALSPVSSMPIDSSTARPRSSRANFIEVNLDDSNLIEPRVNSNPASRAVIDKVQVFFQQTGDEGGWSPTWKLITTMTVDELEATDYKFKFYNDGVYSPLPATEANKLFDAVPIKVGTMDIIQDRLFLGDLTEGFDLADINTKLNLSILPYGQVPDAPISLTDYVLDAEKAQTTPFRRRKVYNSAASQGSGSNPVEYTRAVSFQQVDQLGQEVIYNSFISTYQPNRTIRGNIDAVIDITNYSDISSPTVSTFVEARLMIGAIIIDAVVIAGDGIVNLSAANAFIPEAESVRVEIFTQFTFDGSLVYPKTADVSFDINVGSTFDVVPLNAISAATGASYSSQFKRGGSYKFGIVYYDRANRSSSVHTSDDLELYIPWFSEDLNVVDPVSFPVPQTFEVGVPYIDWEIRHRPPRWATHYQWVRTLESNYDRYVQFVVQDAFYVKRYLEDPATTEPDIPAITVPYGDTSAKEVYISLSSILFYKDENSDSIVESWIPEPNDRIRLMATSPTDFYQEMFDLPIKAIRGEYLVVDLRDVSGQIPSINTGDLVEVLTPKKQVEERLYYEFSEEFEVNNPHTPERAHKGQSADQSSDLLQTARGRFRYGDTFYRSRDMPTRPFNGTDPQPYPNNINDTFSYLYYVESDNVSDFYRSDTFTRGRANIENSDEKEQRRISSVRFSNKSIVDTFLFNLRQFEPLNDKQFPREWGILRKLKAVAKTQQEGNVLLSLFEKETASIYVEESILRDTFDTQVVAITDRIIGRINKLRGNYGTLHPESVVEWNELVYWIDIQKGKVLRYSKAGLQPISDYKMQSFFTGMANEFRENRRWVSILGGYDPEYDEYILSIRQFNEPPPEVIEGDEVDPIDPVEDDEGDGDPPPPPPETNNGGCIISEVIQEGAVLAQYITRDDGGSWIDDGVLTYQHPIKFVLPPQFPPFADVSSNGRAISDTQIRITGPSYVPVQATDTGEANGRIPLQISHNTTFLNQEYANVRCCIGCNTEARTLRIADPNPAQRVGVVNPINGCAISDVVTIGSGPTATQVQYVTRDDGGSWYDDLLPEAGAYINTAQGDSGSYSGQTTFLFCPGVASPVVNSDVEVISDSQIILKGVGGFIPVSLTHTGEANGRLPMTIIQTIVYLRPITQEEQFRGAAICGTCPAQGGGPPADVADEVNPPQLTVNVPSTSPAFTIAFHEPSNRWTSFYSFTPEYYGISNIRLLSFDNGNAWLHNSNDLHCNFYGLQQKADISYVVNMKPNSVKIFLNSRIEASSLWFAPLITNKKGQLTKLIEADYINREDIFHADILRDENTPNVDNPLTEGDEMRSQTLNVTLEVADPSKFSELYFSNVDFIISSGSYTSVPSPRSNT